MTTTTQTAEAVAYLVRDAGWGPWVKVTVAPTPEADKAAAAFFARVTKYVVGENYHVAHVDEETTGPLGEALEAHFYPTCEHGMSLSLCAGPQHYPFDDEERAHYGY